MSPLNSPGGSTLQCGSAKCAIRETASFTFSKSGTCFRHLTESPVLLKSVSDVEEFINYCPPQEISANSCVLGLYGTSDKNG